MVWTAGHVQFMIENFLCVWSHRANLEHPELYSMYILIASPPAKKRSPVIKWTLTAMK
jgi:hypothetical protein